MTYSVNARQIFFNWQDTLLGVIMVSNRHGCRHFLQSAFMALAMLMSCLSSQAQAQGVAPTTKEPSRAQALKALDLPSAQARLAAVVRLADVGSMADADRVAERLHDENAQVRLVAGAALWQIWSRSGSKAIDSQYQRGVQLMEAAQLKEAVNAFSDIIKKQPTFAEAWNKRATLYFLLGEDDLSLKDCEEVLKRNPQHFGVLAGNTAWPACSRLR